jgi:hypothetical protein
MLLLSLSLFVWPASAWAGGGPENVLLLVNPKSPASLCIANHYIRLRQIPAENVVFVPWDPKVGMTDVDTFRKQIVAPAFRAISSRRLDDQIDMLIYSSDFPWGITLDNDVKKFLPEMRKSLPAPVAPSGKKANDKKPGDKQPAKSVEWPVWLGPTGSINGLTYLWQPVVLGSPAYFDLQTNYYMRRLIPEQREARSIGFRASRQYDVRGQVVASGGRRYLLSTMLGVTTGRGNTVAEVLNYLRRSAAADGTHPKGTIYFTKNKDIRTTKREEFSPSAAAVSELQALGVNAKIVEGTVPLNRKDVQGVVMGTQSFDWKASGSTILPGAICEHFTSFGGVMRRDAGQTPLSEFLRYGAAGSSGTVAEPIALYQKFPASRIQVHYARGCTLAEAFYQSVWAPYQLLIVGDPLCRPWADIPRVSVAGVEAKATVQGRLKLEPTIKADDNVSVDHFELFVDGLRTGECEPTRTLSLDTTALPDGYHELRVVAVGRAPIETQGRRIIAIHTANHGRKIEASLDGRGPWRADKPVTISVRSPDSIGIAAMRGDTIIGRIAGEEGKIEIPANTLGAGPVRIRLVGLGSGSASTNVVADPLEITLQ